MTSGYNAIHDYEFDHIWMIYRWWIN